MCLTRVWTSVWYLELRHLTTRANLRCEGDEVATLGRASVRIWRWDNVGGRKWTGGGCFHSPTTRGCFRRHSRCFQYEINSCFINKRGFECQRVKVVWIPHFKVPPGKPTEETLLPNKHYASQTAQSFFKCSLLKLYPAFLLSRPTEWAGWLSNVIVYYKMTFLQPENLC